MRKEFHQNYKYNYICFSSWPSYFSILFMNGYIPISCLRGRKTSCHKTNSSARAKLYSLKPFKPFIIEKLYSAKAKKDPYFYA